jgi:hypothetical protein
MGLMQKLKGRNLLLLVVDLLMMLLLLLNLGLILFDWLFSIPLLSGWLEAIAPVFHGFYRDNIHLNFYAIDLAFVGVFLLEFFFSWALSVRRKQYYKWFFYPFIHWYDLLGCIPVSAFRFMRIFRVFSILFRLHRMGLIDLTRTHPYKLYVKYREVLVEEVSDRVVINVLSGVQEEIREGGPLVGRIVEEVLRPRRDLIARWMSHRLKVATGQNYLSRQEEVRIYIDRVIGESLQKSEEIAAIEQMPVMGRMVSRALARSISGIVYNVLDGLMQDLASDKNQLLVGELTDAVFDSISAREEDGFLKSVVTGAFVESIELVKEQVRVQQWKLNEEARKTSKTQGGVATAGIAAAEGTL